MAGKMVGEFPGLQKGLDTDGNVAATSDLRGVYSAHRVRAGRVIVELREQGMHAVLRVVRRK